MLKEHKRYYAPSGEEEEISYLEKINKDGKKYLIENGKTNVYQRTQEALVGSTLDEIISRASNGDYSVLNNGGAYFDATVMPNDLMSAQNALIASKKLWETAPDELKNQFKDLNDFLENYIPEETSLPTQNELEQANTTNEGNNDE